MNLAQDTKIEDALVSDVSAPRCVDLDEVLSYRHDGVIERFIAEQGTTRAEAELLFMDVKRWLWLCHENVRERFLGIPGVPPQMTVFATQNDMDMMWHTFILFTWDYTQFCRTYFGRFIHHFPTLDEERRLRAAERSLPGGREAQDAAYLKAAGYAYDKLGADVARRWYIRRQEPAAAQRLDTVSPAAAGRS
jgi:hypothetical protein